MHMRTNGCLLAAYDFGNFCIGHSVPHTQNNYVSLLFGKQRDSARNDLGGFRCDCRIDRCIHPMGFDFRRLVVAVMPKLYLDR